MNTTKVEKPTRAYRFDLQHSHNLKRILDYLFGVPLFLCALPVMLVIALIIKVISPGPVLYVQEREGYRGSTIRLLKFRTMHLDADERLANYFRAYPEKEAQWLKLFKLEDDPRLLPRVGKLLRRSSLDELPNLWNLLRGDITLVGPRPFPFYHVERFEPEFRALRQSVRPGLTGLWQLERGGVDAQKKWDTLYIDEWCMTLDLKILARTVLMPLKGKAFY
jgi:lipopolysaccharide/colanic/teichoic acid biosynthesis glycosyltransferase